MRSQEHQLQLQSRNFQSLGALQDMITVEAIGESVKFFFWILLGLGFFFKVFFLYIVMVCNCLFLFLKIKLQLK